MIAKTIHRALRKAARGRLIVLSFHDILDAPDPLQPDAIDINRFEMLLDWAQRHFEVLDLEQALRERQSNQPARACLTFDDGYPSWLNTVVPRLLARGLPATFFVATASLEKGIHWHQRLTKIIRGLPNTGITRIGDLVLDGSTAAARMRSARLLEHAIKPLPPQMREASLLELEKIVPPAGTESAMSLAQLHRLADAGFAIGAHSHDHPILSRISLTEAEDEIRRSRDLLRQELGVNVSGFAFPNGRPNLDFDDRHVNLLRDMGFSHAVTTGRGCVKASDDPLRLKRFTPWGSTAEACSRQTLLNLALGR